MKLKQTLLVAALLASAGISNAALIDQNLALNKPVNASNGTATAAVDGNPGSRWETTWEDNQWIYVDLGAVYNLDHLRLLWEGAYTKHYQVCVAEELTSEMLANLNDEDATNNFATGWTVAADQTYDSFVSDQTVSVKGFAGRYVAINCIERGTQWGNSIYELEVYANSIIIEPELNVTPDVLGGYLGTTVNFTAAGLNADASEMDLTDAVWTMNGEPMTSQTVTFDTKGFYTVKVAANGIEAETTVGIFDAADNFVTPSLLTQQSDNTTADASKAIDGDEGSMWEANVEGTQEYNAWMVVDLGSELDVNGCYLYWEGATSAEYTVEVSTDGIEYIPVFSYASNQSMGSGRYDWVFDGESHKARFVKINSTKAATGYGVKLRELQIFGEGTLAPAELANLELTADNNVGATGTKFNFSFSALDQYGNPWELSEGELSSLQWTVTPAETANIENNVLTVTEKGVYSVYCSLGEVVSNAVEVNVVADGENVALNKVVETVATSSSNAANAVDGDLATTWDVPIPEDAVDGMFDAWLVVDLGKDYEVNCINCHWGPEASADYSVLVSATGEEGSYEEIYSRQSDEWGVGKDHDDWFYGDETHNARFIKIESRKMVFPDWQFLKMKELQVFVTDGTSGVVDGLQDAAMQIFVMGDVLRFSAEANAAVYNMNGVAVATVNGVSEMNVSSLPSGVYVVKAVDMNGNVATVKVVK
jgi:coagulation factor 5/8 type domain protein